MSLPQAMGILLGADIGTTFVVMLLAIRPIADYALLMLITGVLLEILSKKKKTKYFSRVLLGFGFVFFGMHLMVLNTSPLKESPLLNYLFYLLSDKPEYAFLGATLFTALVQNSATTLGLTIALSFSQLLTLQGAIPLILGANVGTCAGSLIHSLAAQRTAGKRVALAHLFFKTTGALIALFFLPTFYEGILWVSHYLRLTATHVASQVALTHVLFNLLLSCFFIPFIRPGAWLVQHLLPEPHGEANQPFGPKYLDPKSLETPAIAFANAKREILRMAEIAFEMFRDTILVFEKNDRELQSFIEEQDDKIDMLDREIKFFLAKISQENLNMEQARLQLNLVAITSDLEEICDILNKNILELAEKKINKGRHFSQEGWQEIADVHTKVEENFQLMVSTLTTEDETLARKMGRHEKHLATIEDHYRESHLLRLHKGMKETIETSSIHLDLLANFRRINTKLTTIVKALFPGQNFSLEL